MSNENAKNLAGLQPGFADPVHDAQRCFRTVLDAMAHAGRVADLSCDLVFHADATPLNIAQAAILLALSDHDTRLWLHPSLRTAGLEAWLRFHTGAPLCEDSAAAAFVILPDLANLPPLDALRVGTNEYPDRSATVLVAVPELAQDGPLSLRGPGIAGSRSLYAGGWNDAVSAWRADNERFFPCGVDVILCCDSRIAALPRTTLIEQCSTVAKGMTCT